MDASTSVQSEGHPRALGVLFFTEMWERFSYYGMRALLVLYLTKSVGFSDNQAFLLYGAYTTLVYITPVAGGYLADHYIGAKRAVAFGGSLIALGHITLACTGLLSSRLSEGTLFHVGLSFIIGGTGFLKPNISALVGELYRDRPALRNNGFLIFYIGINSGAALGALVCGWLGERFGWHYGFGAAGIGMIAGLICFLLLSANLPEARPVNRPSDSAVAAKSLDRKIAFLGLGMIGAIMIALQFQEQVGWVVLALAALALVPLARDCRSLTREQNAAIGVLLFLIALNPLFWALFEQAGSSLNLLTDRYVDRQVGDFSIPATWFQSVNSILLIVMTPPLIQVWSALARRGREPSPVAKFALGLLLISLGFLGFAALLSTPGAVPLPALAVVLFYLTHTIGELCFSPVGLAAISRHAPAHMVSSLMGLWFLSTAAGNFLGSMIARATGEVGGGPTGVEAVSATYHSMGLLVLCVALGVFAIASRLNRALNFKGE